MFSTLAGVCDARVAEDTILGRWCDELRWFTPRGDLSPAENFANHNSRGESVARFTKRYGPLFMEPKPGAKFQFPMSEWLSAQDGFRFLWEGVGAGARSVSWGKLGARDDLATVVEFDESEEWRLLPGRGDGLVYVGRHLTYRTGTVFRFLVLDLLSRDPARLRKCKRPDCEHPYFVARHLNQQFCSDRCAAWGQREWKRLWWNQRGKQWRAAQRSKVKSRKRR
jgi:hypothetical protein